jgi:hypothetical protein
MVKKIAIVVSSTIFIFLGYYFTIGREKAIEELKAVVDRELQTLQKSGFVIEDRDISKSSEHFVIRYADSKRIAKYLNSKNIEMSIDDSQELEDMRVATDINYLDGLYSAISVDIYPISLSNKISNSLSISEKRAIDKIIKEKILLLHVDINKLFNSFKGYLKDIDTTIEDSSKGLKIFSRGFRFGGDFDKNGIQSSSQDVDRVEIISTSDFKLLIDSGSGLYDRDGSIYEYSSSYNIKSLLLEIDKSHRVSVDGVDISSKGDIKEHMASASYSMKISKADITQSDKSYILESIVGLISVENFSIEAMERITKLDKNDLSSTKIVMEKLLSKELALKVDKLSVDRIKERSSSDYIGGFYMDASANIAKPIDFRAVEQNLLSLGSYIEAKVHIELSDKLYIALQRYPNMILLSMILKPIVKKDRVLFELDYLNGRLRINGKSIL